jgi:hypothetical protein
MSSVCRRPSVPSLFVFTSSSYPSTVQNRKIKALIVRTLDPYYMAAISTSSITGRGYECTCRSAFPTFARRQAEETKITTIIHPSLQPCFLGPIRRCVLLLCTFVADKTNSPLVFSYPISVPFKCKEKITEKRLFSANYDVLQWHNARGFYRSIKNQSNIDSGPVSCSPFFPPVMLSFAFNLG